MEDELIIALENDVAPEDLESVHAGLRRFNYEGLGYSVFGVLEGYPPGYDRYYLRKHL